MKPRLRLPMDLKQYIKGRIVDGKKKLTMKDYRGTVEALSDIREALENYERRINQKPTNNGKRGLS
jgi:hypothetical protein